MTTSKREFRPWRFFVSSVVTFLLIALPDEGPASTPKNHSAPKARIVSSLLRDGAITLVGESGELYAPKDDLTWERVAEGGVATDVLAVFEGGSAKDLFAVGTRLPLFEWHGQNWTVSPTFHRGSCAVSKGPIPLFSAGQHIYHLRDAHWKRVATSKTPIRAVWAASPDRIYIITTDNKLFRGKARSFRAIPTPLHPDENLALLGGDARGSTILATTDQGRILRVSANAATPMKLPPNILGLRVHAISTGNQDLTIAATSQGTDPERTILLRPHGNDLTIMVDVPPLVAEDHVAVVYEANGDLLVVTYRGQVHKRPLDGDWRQGKLLPYPTPTIPAKHGPAHTR